MTSSDLKNRIKSSNKINMRHNLFTIGLLIILIGCANNNVWVKNGAGTNELKADEYSCMQYSHQHLGTAPVDQYGGKAQSGQSTNLTLFNSCMESKGWSFQNKDAYQAAPVQKKVELKQQKTEVKVAMNKVSEKINAVCTKSEFAPIFLKTPCLDGDITVKQIADSSKITAEQKPIFLKYHTEIDIINNESSKYLHSLNLGSDVSQAGLKLRK
jgi:hypothetical protein